MATTKKTTKAKQASAAKKASTPKKASTAKKPSTAKKASTAGKKSIAEKTGEATLAVNRRSGKDRRRAPDRRFKDEPVGAERRKLQRRVKVNRRRQIDPTTCERDYNSDEIEFMNALDQYKRASGRMFPTCSEVLEVIKKLGYEKRPNAEPGNLPVCGLASGLPSGQVPETTAI